MANERQERDLVLPPNTFALVLDRNKGNVNSAVGPFKLTLSDTEMGVRYDPTTRRYEAVVNIADALQNFPFASEGSYIVLENPVITDKGNHPTTGNSNIMPDLAQGRKINIPGPIMFPLWPSQSATVIKGHTLRSNEYLLVEVYNAEAARENWARRVSAPQAESTQTAAMSTAERNVDDIDPSKLVNGQKLVIKGTDVSFYIPPTGIQVLEDPDADDDTLDKMIRRAVTLENLQFCILKDEQGRTRYERGPQVVFPKPTEQFERQANDEQKMTRRFRAFTLTALQGIHVQVIADYTEPGTPPKTHKIGEELFILGSNNPIYYPIPQHAIIKYDDQDVYNSITVPEGEGRYVLDRRSGTIELIAGPKMLLPDPRTHVLVRRALTDDEVDLYFPGNTRAKLYNQQLRQMAEMTSAAGATANYVSESTILSRRGAVPDALMEMGFEDTGLRGLTASATPAASYKASNVRTARPQAADQIKHGTTFTPPRQITLDTRFDGAVLIRPYVGYAVKVVSKTGRSRIVAHPQVALLGYDENLQTMNLSTGTPKVDDRPARTVYLRVSNNKVSDRIEVETSDMVKLHVTLSMRVNFEGEQDHWFSVDNYIKLLTEHVRSRVTAAVKQITIQQFHSNAAMTLRTTILGESKEGQKRPGMVFEENGMRVYEVEVSTVTILDPTIAAMIQTAAINSFKSNIEVADAERRLTTTRMKEDIEQQIATATSMTVRKKIEIAMAEAAANFDKQIAAIVNDLRLYAERLKTEEASQAINNLTAKAELDRRKASQLALHEEAAARQKLAVEMLMAEVEAIKGKFGTFDGPFAEALLALSSQETLVKIRQAMTPMEILGGTSVQDTLSKIFDGTPIKAAYEEVMKQSGNVATVLAGPARRGN